MTSERSTPELLDEVRKRRQSIANERAALTDARDQNRRVHGPAGTAASLGLAVACMLAGYLVSPVLMIAVFVPGLFLIVRWLHKPSQTRPEPLPAPGRSVPELSLPQLERELESLRRDERNARLARCAEQRAAYAIPMSRSATGYLDLIIGASLLGPLAGAILIFGFGMLAGTEPYDPAIWAGLALLAGGLAVLRWFRLRRRRRQLQLEAGLSALASRWRGGSCLKTPEQSLAWLNSFWAAGHVSDDLWAGPVHRAAAGRYHDYPVLVDVEPDGCSGDDVTVEPHVVVYLAAVDPQGAPGDEVQHVSRSLAAAGFQLDVVPEAGLVARATQPTVKLLRKRLDDLDELRHVIEMMTVAARATGSAPAPPGERR